MTPSLVQVLEDLYASEINVSISCFWDGGWAVKLGDPANGFRAEVTLDTLDDAPRWLIDQAKRHYPGSQFSITH